MNRTRLRIESRLSVIFFNAERISACHGVWVLKNDLIGTQNLSSPPTSPTVGKGGRGQGDAIASGEKLSLTRESNPRNYNRVLKKELLLANWFLFLVAPSAGLLDNNTDLMFLFQSDPVFHRIRGFVVRGIFLPSSSIFEVLKT